MARVVFVVPATPLPAIWEWYRAVSELRGALGDLRYSAAGASGKRSSIALKHWGATQLP